MTIDWNDNDRNLVAFMMREDGASSARAMGAREVVAGRRRDATT